MKRASGFDLGVAAKLRLKPVWCVEYHTDKDRTKKAWCATFRGHKPSKDASSDPTACGFNVMFRIGSAKRLPTCEECLVKLARRRENRKPKAPPRLQDPLKSLTPAERTAFVPISDERIDAMLAAGARSLEAAKNPRSFEEIVKSVEERPITTPPSDNAATPQTYCTYPEILDATDGACPAWWRAEERISKVWKERYDKLEGRFKSNEEMFRWAKAHKSEVERLNLEVKKLLSLLEEAGALMNRVVKMPADWEKDWGKWRGKVIDLHDRDASHVANPHFCEHANECPQMCPCDRRCYCRTRTCRSPR